MTHEEIEIQLNTIEDYNNKAEYEEAEQLCKEILIILEKFPLYSQQQRDSLSARALRLRVQTLQRRGRANDALSIIEEALALARQADDRVEFSKSMNMKGLLYSNLGEYFRAIECYEKALATHEELGMLADAALSIGNIGLVHQHLGQSSLALEYHLRALTVHQELENKRMTGGTMVNIGSVYKGMEDYTSALEYFTKALAIFDEIGEILFRANAFENIGSLHMSMGNFSRTVEYYSKALAIYEELGNNASAARTTANIGILYAGKEFEGYDAAKAEEMLLKALAIDEELGLKHQLYLVHLTLAELYENTGRELEAYRHFKKYHELEKEVQSDEAKKKSEQIEQQKQAAEQEKRLALAQERESILNNILPEEITQRLIKGENPIADHFDAVSILFMDLVDFTKLASTITAQQLVHLLNAIFKAADGVMREFGLEKIKTIGDAYMAVAGAPVPQADHARRAAQAALKLLDVMQNLVVTFPDNYGDRTWIASIPEIEVRIGLHCGSVAAGVVGENKFLYDLWGDAVNTASRMESHGEAGKIHVSEEFMNALSPSSLSSPMSLQFVPRDKMDIKGKGIMKTYFLEKA